MWNWLLQHDIQVDEVCDYKPPVLCTSMAGPSVSAATGIRRLRTSGTFGNSGRSGAEVRAASLLFRQDGGIFKEVAER